jgi:hypothetical protein
MNASYDDDDPTLWQQLISRNISSSALMIHVIRHLVDPKRNVCTRYSDRGKHTWYIYDGRRWQEDTASSPFALMRDLATKGSRFCMTQATAALQRNDPAAHRLWEKTSLDFEHHDKRQRAIRQAALFFAPDDDDDDFPSRLDADPDLLGFDDGVLNLGGTGVFCRGPRPDDFLSLSTGHAFGAPDAPAIQAEIQAFLDDILPDPAVQGRLLDVLADSLGGGGGGRPQPWCCMVGRSFNGRGTLSMLMRAALGTDYALATALIGVCANAKDRAFFNVDRKRLLAFFEPADSTDALRKIAKSRPPDGATLLLECNKVPNLARLDAETAARIQVFHFPHMFVPTPTLPYHRRADVGVRKRMGSKPYGAQFLRMLVRRRVPGGVTVEEGWGREAMVNDIRMFFRERREEGAVLREEGAREAGGRAVTDFRAFFRVREGSEGAAPREGGARGGGREAVGGGEGGELLPVMA